MTLKELLKSKDRSLYSVCKETGLHYGNLWRIANTNCNFNIDTVLKLNKLGITVTITGGKVVWGGNSI